MDPVWYVARNGQSFGPFSFDQLVAAARGGRLRKEDLFWQPGMETWQPSTSIAGLWLPPPQPASALASSPTDSRLAQSNESLSASDPLSSDITHEFASSTEPAEKVEVSVKPEANFFLRHWRGELSLAKSYWIVGSLFTILLLLFSAVFGQAITNAKLSPAWLGLLLTTFLVSICAFSVWQLVGIWRSAGNHIRTTKRRGWAIAARVAVVLGALRLLVDFSNIIAPMLSESLQLASGKDNIPAHEIRLLRDGRELELSGGMPFGTADAVKKFLDAAPAVEVVHLNSLGGRLREGFELLMIFRARGIVTYTSVDCVSACTIAFLGGSQRYLSEEAKLGFHSASFGGLDQKDLPELNSEMRAVLTAHGAPSWFVHKALSTDAASMWYPTTDELITAKIVMAVVDPGYFAMSGVKDWRDTAALEQALSQVPYARALKQYNPSAYAKIAKRFIEAVRLGKSRIELANEFYAVFSGDILPDYLRSAPDAALVRYWKSQIAEIRYLGDVDGQLCIEHLNLVPRRQESNLAKIVPSDLIAEDLAALTALVEATHTLPPPSPVDPKALESDYAVVIANVERSMVGVSAIVSEPQNFTDRPQLLCKSFVAFYEAILALPQDRAGRMLRSIAAEN